MAITIPSNAVKTFEKLIGAMGGEDYSYYLFDVKNANEKPTEQVVLAITGIAIVFTRLQSVTLLLGETTKNFGIDL